MLRLIWANQWELRFLFKRRVLICSQCFSSAGVWKVWGGFCIYFFIAESGCIKLTSHLQSCGLHRLLRKLDSSAQWRCSSSLGHNFIELKFISGRSQSITITSGLFKKSFSFLKKQHSKKVVNLCELVVMPKSLITIFPTICINFQGGSCLAPSKWQCTSAE